MQYRKSPICPPLSFKLPLSNKPISNNKDLQKVLLPIHNSHYHAPKAMIKGIQMTGYK